MPSELLLGVASLSLAGLVWWKQYRFLTVVEYGVLATLFIVGAPISFSLFQSMKVLVSLVVFIVRNAINQFSHWERIQYFIGSWKRPCNTSAAVAETVCHNHLPNSWGATFTEQSTSLVPGKCHKTASKLQKASFWAPCVGFVLHAEESDNFVKCPDWSTMAMYLLSRDKFLSYSSVIYMRWLTIICVGLNALCHALWALISYQIEKEYGSRTSTTSAVVGLWTFTILDILHMLVVAFDICNLSVSRIEFNDKKSLETLSTYIGMFVGLMLFALIYLSYFPASTRWFGYYIYLALCIFTAVIVHFSVVEKELDVRRRRCRWWWL